MTHFGTATLVMLRAQATHVMWPQLIDAGAASPDAANGSPHVGQCNSANITDESAVDKDADMADGEKRGARKTAEK